MKLYLDTANIEQIREIAGWGILDGVTTNPSLMAKEKGDYKKILKEICDIVKGPVSGEVLSLEKDSMVEEARELSSISEHVVIKIPCTADGLKATRQLNSENIPVNMTLVFSANQGLLGIKAGARYISSFVGRLDDIGNPGINVVEDLLALINLYRYDTEVIFASIRHPEHVRQAAIIGSHIATIPYNIFIQLIKHPLTDVGIERFLKDWQNK
ncbi:fructose-6-phosphate aldolase [candidate division WOR-3 bacterium RBG_13_43_14]|uniref:Fructose-6-phosphate aldolase n=1 Tax=candidate division WOR-3 bacterium RBG_13_43_14 TaxID=1802590 RepID=A0A1F4UAG7_UNCW3|nr:MAG: fructose-6-phosphate aldolase [candidate division WOR-3 bacterium RBG_13_43_14]